MLLAGFAASAAIDLLSALLEPERPASKAGNAVSAQSAFADLQAVRPALAEPPAGGRSESLSREALDTLLSAQGQSQHKKRATSVLLELLQSSQTGSVGRSELAAVAGEGEASGVFDRIDQNHDGSINRAELTSFLETYRRNADTGTRGQARALAVVA